MTEIPVTNARFATLETLPLSIALINNPNNPNGLYLT